MTHSSLSLPRRIGLAALVVGVAGDALMRGGMLRLGFALWIAVLALCLVAVGGAASLGRTHRQRTLLVLGAVLAAWGLVWRDAEMLYVVDLLSVFCMGALTMWYGSGGRLQSLSVIEALRAALLAVVNTIGGAVGVVAHGRVRGGPAGEPAGRARAILIGVVLAVPPLVLVTALLTASDAVFKRLLDRVLTVLAIDGIQHLLVAAVLAWMAAGWLRAALGQALRTPFGEVRSPALLFPSVGVGLYALIALLTLFVATQLRVLFGGESFLMSTQGLTVAAYAREGFFQLVVAAGVVLVTLIAADWLLDEDNAVGRRRYRVTGAALLVLVFAMLVSAATRMWLYVREFGWSIDRAIACAIMLWVVMALVVFAGTVLRGRTDRFAPIGLMATVAWEALLNVVTLEAMVVRVNVGRAVSGRTFDAAYHAQLSADALPALLASAPRLSAGDCTALSDALKKTWSRRLADAAGGARDWRVLDLSLLHATRWYDAGTPVCP